MKATILSDSWWGWFPQSIPNATALTTRNINSAALRFGSGFYLKQARTLTKYRHYATITGAPVAADAVLSIFSDNGGVPGTELWTGGATTIEGAGAVPRWIEWDISSLALSASTQYWAVMRNANATPASNYFRFQYLSTLNSVGAQVLDGPIYRGFHKIESSDSGATWATAQVLNTMTAYRMQFSTGEWAGTPLIDVNVNGVAGTRLYGTREVGVKFTTPANVKFNVSGAVLALSRQGTIAGAQLTAKIYNGTTLVATSDPISIVGSSFLTEHAFTFPTAVTLNPSTAYRVVAAINNLGDSATNYVYFSHYGYENVADSLALKPLRGTLSRTVWDGSAWADADDYFLPVLLLMDADAEFASSGGTPPNAYDLRKGVVNNGVTGTLVGSVIVN